MNETLKFSSYGKGLPLVFIHGWGVNSAVWQPLIPELSKCYRVITIDLPGFGENEHIQLDEYSLENIAKLIVESVDTKGVYIGWSLGGLVASCIALTYPETLHSLVTVASSPCFIEHENWPAIKPVVLKGFHQQLAENPEQTIKGFLKIQAMGSPNIRQDIKKISTLVMQYNMPNQTTLSHSLTLLETSDYRKNLSDIQQPFLRLYGRLDGLVPQGVINQVNQLAPKSESYIFQNSSHAPFISEPEVFIQQLTRWLLSL